MENSKPKLTRIVVEFDPKEYRLIERAAARRRMSVATFLAWLASQVQSLLLCITPYA
jgi:uncharacterized protein (DUF1778 family)